MQVPPSRWDMPLILTPPTSGSGVPFVSLYLQTDEFDKAVDAATRALGYHPESANLTFMRGISHGQAKHYDKAIPDFEHAIELADSGDVKFVSEVLQFRRRHVLCCR